MFMSKEPKDKPKQIKIHSGTSPHFRRIIADRVYGTLDSIGLKVIIFSEHNDIEKVIDKEPMDPQEIALVRTIECELIIKPEQMKALMVWITNKVQDYEAIYGRIPAPEEVDSKMEKHYKEKSNKSQDLR